MTALAGPLIRRGFSRSGARLWVREKYRDWREPSRSRAEVWRSHREGFTTPTFANRAATVGDVPAQPLSPREFHALRPINPRSRWRSNRIVAARTIPGLDDLLAPRLAVIMRSQPVDESTLLQTDREQRQDGVDTALALARSRGAVRIHSLSWGRGAGLVLTSTRAGYAVDGAPVGGDELEPILVERLGGSRWVVTACESSVDALAVLMDAPSAVVRLYVGKYADGTAHVLDAGVVVGLDDVARRDGRSSRTNHHIDRGRGRVVMPGSEPPYHRIPRFAEIVADVERVFNHPSARFDFVSIDVVVQDAAHHVVDVDPIPAYPSDRLFAPDADEFLRGLFEERAPARQALAARRSLPSRMDAQRLRFVRRVRSFRLRAGGFTGPAARSWVWRLQRERRAEGFSRAERSRAHGWGFSPELVAGFEISEESRRDLVSLRDYLYAQPLNGKYEKWIRDRVSASMVFAPFREHFDTVHYQLFRRGGLLHVSPISPEALSAGTSLEDMGALIASEGTLVLTGSSWRSRTKTAVAYDGEGFSIDGIPCTPADFREVLSTFVRSGSSVLVAEAGAKTALDESPLRVDVLMINPDGAHPQVAEASTVVAELAADRPGGDASRCVARIDPRTGRWGRAHALVAGRVRSFASDPVTGARFDGEVPGWGEVVATLERMGAFAPQLRFVQFRLLLSGGHLRVERVTSAPRYSDVLPFEPATVAFLREVVDTKRALWHRPSVRISRALHNAKLKIRRDYAAAFFPKGLLPYQSVRWPGDIRRDLLQRNGIPLRTKLWAYRHGYLSYRIPQYGITPENRHQFISDFEYRWLRHINESYKYWLEDKVSIKYVAADFSEYLPGYYFYTTRSGDRNHVVPMMDCPEGYGSDYEDVLRLAREKGVLALKPDEGSHGDGFYRLGWDGETYSLNGESATATDVVAVLNDPDNRYLITEFIDMHPTLAAIYPHSVNTIRMIVFKKDGVTPELGNVYLRIGSVASGFVDNTAAGGMLAEIDVETGRFGDAKTLVRGRVEPCPRHPDTGVLIEGVVPHWEHVKREVLRMAENFSQLEYLGFDVAVTPDGFRVPEINRFPDFPRIDRFTPETIDYLLMKLAQKKRRFGYDRRRPRSLVSLPARAVR
ncbi:MAG: sugar-transfer associated ATP-grasp domain-containing protein [Actinomycetota bacterium]